MGDELFREGRRGKLRIRSMRLSHDGRYVWLDGKAQISTRDGEEVGGSDFVEFDMKVRGRVSELDDGLSVGESVDIEYDGRFWVPKAPTSAVTYVDKNPCSGECGKCPKVGADGFCTQRG